MTIQFQCPHCQKRLKADDAQAGKRFRCTGCSQIAIVPRGDAASAKVSAFIADQAGPDAPIRFKRRIELDTELDMTPMVDVTFLLLIFFMVTAAFALQKAFESPTRDPNPDAATLRPLDEQLEDMDNILVEIREDDDVWVEDHEAPTLQALIRSLQRVRAEREPAPDTLLIQVHPESSYHRKIMVHDAGQQLGITNIREVPFDDY